jgi:hypothetical protein
MIKTREFHTPAVKQYIAHLNDLIAEQQAYEHAVKTGEIKRTPLNSTPAQRLDDA